MTKYSCKDCDCQVDDFDDVWDHVNGFSHVMQIANPKKVKITSTSLTTSEYIDDYLFMANCTMSEFYNYLFVWNNK